MLRRALVLAILLLFASLPLASAQAWPAPKGNTEPVDYWYVWTGSTFCGGGSLAALSLAVGSNVHIEPDADGSRYTFRLTAPAPRPDCSAMYVLEFESSVDARPGLYNYATGDVRSVCGMTGSMGVFQDEDNRYVSLSLDIPAACDAGIVGRADFSIYMKDVRPSTLMVCLPYVMNVSCAGAQDETRSSQTSCPSGHSSGATMVTPGPVIYGTRYCYQDETVYVFAAFGIVSIRATESSCTASAWALTSIRTACPAEAGAILFAVPWGNLIP